MRSFTIIAVILGLASIAGCANPFGGDPGAVAEAYEQAGRYDEAAREIELAVRSHPRNTALRRQAARIHREGGNDDRALGHLEVLAVDLAPGDAEAWIEIGDLETQRKNIDDAYVAYRRAAQLAPDDIRAVSGLALTADSLGFDEEAEAAYASWAELEQQQNEYPANAR
jgi:tetratricopeptide (TPR) repeat protein